MAINKVKDVIHGWGASHSTFTEAAVAKMFYRTAGAKVDAAGTSKLNGTATVFHVFNSTNRVKAASVEFSGSTITASATNYLRLEVHRKTTQTAATSLVGFVSSATANFTSNVTLPLTLVATNVDGSRYEKLVFQVVQSTDTVGQTNAAGWLSVDYEEID